jgi:hypothetical protein
MTSESTLSAALGPCGCDWDAADLVDISDALGNDVVLLRAIEMAVEGIGKEHDCESDANAVAELVRALQARLAERVEHVNTLVPAAPADGEDTTTIGKHPDAMLLAAFDKWIASRRADAEDSDDSEYRTHKVNAEQAERSIERLPAHTLAGVAVKLKFLLHGYTCETAGLDEAFFRGEPITEDVVAIGDYRDVVLVRVLEDVERLSALEVTHAPAEA